MLRRLHISKITYKTKPSNMLLTCLYEDIRTSAALCTAKNSWPTFCFKLALGPEHLPALSSFFGLVLQNAQNEFEILLLSNFLAGKLPRGGASSLALKIFFQSLENLQESLRNSKTPSFSSTLKLEESLRLAVHPFCHVMFSRFIPGKELAEFCHMILPLSSSPFSLVLIHHMR